MPIFADGVRLTPNKWHYLAPQGDGTHVEVTREQFLAILDLRYQVAQWRERIKAKHERG